MNSDSIENIIDKKIMTRFEEGHIISFVKNELIEKMDTFSSAIKNNNENADILKLLLMPSENIVPLKTRYQVIYINHCIQRIKDLDWIVNNRNIFPKLNRSQLFKLLKLKEKLSLKKSIPS
jgi:hypothetical protein